MKNRILYLFAAFMLLFITSCRDKLLDVPDPNALTDANFWKTPDDAEKGLVAVYNMLYRQGTWTRNNFTQLDGMADDGVSYAGWTELAEWSRFIMTNYNFNEVNLKIWYEQYEGVFRANQVLKNVPSIAFTDITEKKQVLAQAKFMRAFFHFYLCIYYGNIPYITEPSTVDAKPKQLTEDEVLTLCAQDFKDAANDLPETWPTNQLGRATKGAALAYLGKVYMQQHKWQDAKDALNWLVEGSGAKNYKLVSNYRDNLTANNEFNSESVMEINFSEILKTGFDVDYDANSNLGTQFAMNCSPKGMGWNNVEMRRWLVDYYLREKTNDGKNDIRLYYNCWFDNSKNDFPDMPEALIYGNTWASQTNLQTWGTRVFPRLYTPDLSNVSDLFYWDDINYRLIRYADVLLCYAEVLNELAGSPPPLAIQLVNQVRARVNLPALGNSTYAEYNSATSSTAAFREHLKIERGLELPFQGIRWMDLKRWGFDAANLAAIKVRDPDFNNFIPGKSERMPIPQIDVDNNPNLKQNPNY